METKNIIEYTCFETKLGVVSAASLSGNLVKLSVADPGAEKLVSWIEKKFPGYCCDMTRSDSNPVLEETARQVFLYLEGKIKGFEVPINMTGTDFQKDVWKAIERIPYGQTRTYADLAREIGSPRAFRAVGGACSCNPVPLIVPCHRVVGSGGRLGGFSGGIDIKKKLLKIEKSVVN